jgi:DNA polymerase I-like protein with 3'-5' exonuclease and polymerase domains
MRLAGTVRYQEDSYFLMVDSQKSRSIYFLVSPFHKDDRVNRSLGMAVSHPPLSLNSFANTAPTSPYIVEIVRRDNNTGNMSSIGRSPILRDVIVAMRKASSYSFLPEQISRNDIKHVGDYIVRNFTAKDDVVFVSYVMYKNMFTSLSYSTLNLGIEIDSRTSCKFPVISAFTLQPLDSSNSINLQASHLRTVDYEMLKAVSEDHLDYYEDSNTGVLKKDYRSIELIDDFEKIVILGIVNELKQAREENRVLYPGVTAIMDLSLDTETSGLLMYDMPVGVSDTVVAVPITWRVDSGVVVFCDMHYFNNVSLEYVFDRLAPFCGKNYGTVADIPITIDTLDGKFTFKRSEINVCGHNAMFDIRACMTVKCEHRMYTMDMEGNELHFTADVGESHRFWFDEDTRILSFNVNPTVIKRSNKLKDLTHRLFNHMTPELSDILGEHNENKFAYLEDKRVAYVYGCSDSDYTLQVLLLLRKLYLDIKQFCGKDIYLLCRKRDMPVANVSARMDFRGIRVDSQRMQLAADSSLRDLDLITKECHRYAGMVIAVKNRMEELRSSFSSVSGVISQFAEEEGGDIVSDNLLEINFDNIEPYVFKLRGKSLTDTMYRVLGYPPSYTKPNKNVKDTIEFKPRLSANKFVMQKLAGVELTSPIQYLKEDIIGSDGNVLISASVMNTRRYPLAYLLTLYGPRVKEYDSYFKPFLDTGVVDRVYRDTSFASIDTRRMSNPLQTIKSQLKDLFLSYSDEYMCFDFDMSQLEIRIMFSLAGDVQAIELMKNSEVDIHIEAASAMYNKLPQFINKYERRSAKVNNFGYAYGIGPYKMCQDLHDGQITDELLYETRKLMESFHRTRKRVVEYLDEIRVGTLKAVEVPSFIRHFLGIDESVPLGKVENAFGFYKLFELDDVSDKTVGRINRQSGNYVIQSFASELFKIVLWRFYLQCEIRGYNDDNRIIWHLTVHDELFGSYHKSIHPIELCKMVKDSCFVHITGHTNYYVGLNIGNSWGEVKRDESEIPAICLDRLVKRYDAGEFSGEVVTDHKAYVFKKISEYIRDRIGELAQNLCGLDEGNVVLDVTDWNDKLVNYTVRKYLLTYYKPMWKVDRSDDVAMFEACTASWLLDRFGGESMLVLTNGTRVTVGNVDRDMDSELVSGVEINLDLTVDEEDSNSYYDSLSWSLTTDEISSFENSYLNSSLEAVHDEEDDVDSLSVSGSLGLSLKSNVGNCSYDNVKILNNRVTISVARSIYVNSLVRYLKGSELLVDDSKNGYECYVSLPLSRKFIGYIDKSKNYSDLDKFVLNNCKELISSG